MNMLLTTENLVYHTFQGRYDGEGDGIDDTPSEDNTLSGFGCDRTRDSCRNSGLDPVTNYMDYSDEQVASRPTLL